jgi:hypothetical protein
MVERHLLFSRCPYLLCFDELKLFLIRHICNPQLQDWRKWESKDEMQSSGCPIACFQIILRSGLGGMSNIDGKKLEVLMKRPLSIIFPRTLEETLSVTSAWLCSWEWVIHLFVISTGVAHIDGDLTDISLATTCKCWLNLLVVSNVLSNYIFG